MGTGALALIEAARRSGVEVCFANPGTTEMPLVLALDQVAGMRAVLGLFEGVCTGAADGWARMTGRPAATLLHLGPGLANGIANLHNARRARTPVVNWIGEHATSHQAFDAPLTSDIEALAGTVGWVRTVRSAAEMAEASATAVRAALGPPGRVASLVVPADCQWSTVDTPAASGGPAGRHHGSAPTNLDGVVERLRRGHGALLLGGSALSETGLRAAARVAAATGAAVWVETFPARQERGRHLPSFPTLPYFPEQAREALASVTALVLAGARDPVAFFKYPGQPSRFAPEGAQVQMLADPDAGVDAAAALEALAEALGAPPWAAPAAEALRYAPKGEALTPETLGHAIAAHTPEGAIVVNEAATTGMVWNSAWAGKAAPHTMLGLTGGSIGQGLPCALGAAIACPDRKVIAFQADGSGLYTLQALWSMAREGSDVTVVVCANRRYRILQYELSRVTATPGPKAVGLTDIGRPDLSWVDLAKGFGVPGVAVRTDVELAAALGRALGEPGPKLIEAVL
ncbi:MAG TPA: acetolactate synthase large subunit [Gemmatimonadales bacterium]